MSFHRTKQDNQKIHDSYIKNRYTLFMSSKKYQIIKTNPEDVIIPLHPNFGTSKNTLGKIPHDAHIQVVQRQLNSNSPRGEFAPIMFMDPPIIQTSGENEVSHNGTAHNNANPENIHDQNLDNQNTRTSNPNITPNIPTSEIGSTATPSNRQSNKYSHHPLSVILVPLQNLIDEMHMHEPLCLDKSFWQDYSKEIAPIINNAINTGRQLDRGSPKLGTWGRTELKVVLDGLSQFLSYSAISAIQGEQEGEALKKDIVDRLYNQIGSAVKALGIFELQRVVPIDDSYDFYKPKHQMVDSMQVNDILVGRILEVRSAGIIHIGDGSIEQEAEVVVGVQAEE